MITFFLDPTTWDMCLDNFGNPAIATDPYRAVQDVACTQRTFQGEAWFNQALGMPFFQSILGKMPPGAFVAQQLQTAALAVSGVLTARAVVTGFADRAIKGQTQITISNGTTLVVTTQG